MKWFNGDAAIISELKIRLFFFVSYRRLWAVLTEFCRNRNIQYIISVVRNRISMSVLIKNVIFFLCAFHPKIMTWRNEIISTRPTIMTRCAMLSWKSHEAPRENTLCNAKRVIISRCVSNGFINVSRGIWIRTLHLRLSKNKWLANSDHYPRSLRLKFVRSLVAVACVVLRPTSQLTLQTNSWIKTRKTKINEKKKKKKFIEIVKLISFPFAEP